MKAAVLEEYGKINVREIEIPEFKADEVLVQVKYASVCGSDQHIYKGEFHPRTSLPMIPGHEFAGIVAGFGNKVKGIEVGEKVTVDPIMPCGECPACKRKHYPACTSLKLIGVDLDGGFTEFLAVKPEMIYRVPDSISHEHAALIELLSIGFHASKRSGLQKTDNIVIWGGGKVGNAILHAAKTITEGMIIMVDPLTERLNIAKSAFPDISVVNPLEGDPVAKIMEITGGKGVDIAFEAVGHFKEIPGVHNPVRSCILSIRGGGKVCTLGLSDIAVDILMKELIWKEAKIITSRVSQGEFADTIAALESRKLNPDKMITGTLDIEKTDNAFQMLENEPQNHLKILLKIS